jgi:hypothetical protein
VNTGAGREDDTLQHLGIEFCPADLFAEASRSPVYPPQLFGEPDEGGQALGRVTGQSEGGVGILQKRLPPSSLSASRAKRGSPV